MIRKLNINDKNQYLALLAQLTTVGNISDAKWFLLFRKMEELKNIEVYVLVAVQDKEKSASSKSCDPGTDEAADEADPNNHNEEIILAAATLLTEQKFIHEGAVVAHIEDVVVAEKARGLGLGKLIVEHLIEKAKEAGAYKVILDTAEDTVGFYSKMGFQKHEVQMRLNLPTLSPRL